MTIKTFTKLFFSILTLLLVNRLYAQNYLFSQANLTKNHYSKPFYLSKTAFLKPKVDTAEVLIYSFEEGRTVPYLKKYINSEDSKTSAVYVCEGNGVVLATPDLGEDASYIWKGPQGFSASSKQIKLEKINPFQAGFYNFSIQKNGTTTIGKVKLMVKEKPKAIASGGVFCQGEIVNLTAFNAGIGVTYKWTQPPTDFFETTPEINVENLNVGKHIFYLSVAKNGCKSIDTANVVIKQLPVAIANNANIKVGEIAKLEAHDAGENVKYIWKGPFLNTTFQKDIEVSGLPSGKYVYILNVLKNGCSSMNVSVVEVGKENEAKASVKN